MSVSDFERLVDFQNLYNSMRAAMRGGSRKSASAKRFYRHALENLTLMKRDLMNRTYTVSPYNEFEVSEPKKRLIKSGSFRDKVLQHCLCDNILIPKLREIFILDNYAGQIGKGTLFGLDRLSEHLLSFYGEYGVDGYILKCDISKFYYSINHDVLKEVVEKYFDDEGIRWICNLLIDSTEGNGLPLGNQCSQVFALMYLDDLDKLVTQELGCIRYGRYSDDFFVIGKSKEELKTVLSRITQHLDERALSLNSKTEIVPIHRGIRFLGFHVYLTDDGKVIRKVYGAKKRQEKKKLRRCAKLVSNGKMSREKFDEIYSSIRNHLSHGNCHNLICELDAMIAELYCNKEQNIV